MTDVVRVASWNLKGRAGKAAARLGAVLADHGGADVALLQEASRGGLEHFCDAAGLDWWVHVGAEFPDLLRARGRAGGTGADGKPHGTPLRVAIAGRGAPIESVTPFPDVPLPEKVLAGWISVDDVRVAVLSYHAPTGVQHKLKKPEQAVRLARWLQSIEGPVIFAGDFNTPKSDPPESQRVRTHWHTGDEKLVGNPGDDLLVGPDPIHRLRDALRLYLESNPSDLARIAEERPDGPLSTSYCTDKHGRNRFRYDAIWVSPHFEVQAIDYFYDEAIAAGTDHALVVAELMLGD